MPVQTIDKNLIPTPVIWQSGDLDPFRNLAFEECVLDESPESLPSLILYENDDAVVIGKNQNPWLECDPDALERESIPILRRMSGGGTVFHARGNLNVGFVVARGTFEKQNQLKLLVDVLRDFRVPAETNERGDILVCGRKVSGNAMCYRADRVLHHLTMLVNADLNRLRNAITPRELGIESRGIASRRMPVANIEDYCPGLTVDSLKRSIVYKFNNVYSVGVVRSAGDLDTACIEARRLRHESWEWRFARTPRFTGRIADGTRVVVRQGFITALVDEHGVEFPLQVEVPFAPELDSSALHGEKKQRTP